MAARIPRAQSAAVVACLRGEGAPVVLLRGPRGVGRTTLVEAAAAEQAEAGRRIVVTTGRALVADLAAAVGVELSEPPSPADAARIVVGLEGGSCDGVVVDDVHGADDRRAQLVHHLVTTVGIPVVLTAPDVARLPEPVEALRIADELAVVEMLPLDLAEMTALTDAAVDGQVASGAIRRLLEESGGLPGEALLVVDTWRRSGRLEPHLGVWSLTDQPLEPSRRAELAQRGAARLDHGDAVGSLRDLREAAAAPLAPGEDPSVAGAALAHLAEAEVLAGCPTGEAVATAVAGPAGEPDHEVAAVWVAATTRSRDEAATFADGTARVLGAAGAWPQAFTAARAAWTLSPSPRRSAALVELAGRDGTERSSLVAEVARAAGDGDVAALEAATAALEDHGLLLDALIGADLTTRHLLDGGPARRAAAAAARADALLARCRVGHLLHVRPEAPRAALTGREREIAEFVAEGWSNREIASRLHVSVRTVEGHVLRVCTKLGVDDRSAVATALAGRAPDTHR